MDLVTRWERFNFTLPVSPSVSADSKPSGEDGGGGWVDEETGGEEHSLFTHGLMCVTAVLQAEVAGLI